MGKLTTYMLVMSGIILLMYFFGLLENTATSGLLNLLLNPSEFANSNLYVQIILIVEVAVVVGATVFSITQRTDFPLIALLVVPLLNFGWDFMAVYAIMASINPIIATVIFSPLFIVYVLTVVEWWRGVDT